jgi:hypothetical protein
VGETGAMLDELSGVLPALDNELIRFAQAQPA